MVVTTRIVIEPIAVRGERGQRYRTYLVDGAELLAETWNPEPEACRELVARGVSGRLEVWRMGATAPAMVIPDIERAARITVKENEKHGPRFAPWAPLPGDLHADAVFRDTGSAPEAEAGEGVP
jgi:hypothetical protein